MRINSTKINFTQDQAREAVLKKLNKRNVFLLPHKQMDMFESVEGIKMVYFPYWIGYTINDINVKLLGRKTIHMVVAVEGYKGEAGISLGLPECESMEVDDRRIINPLVGKQEAEELILAFSNKHILKQNRHVPKVVLENLELIWKPTYIIPIYSYKSGRIIYKVVDAESNYLIYRYDLDIVKLIETVPELKNLAV